MPPATQRLTEEQLIANTLPLVFVIDSCRSPRTTAAARTNLAEQLLACLIETDDRILRIIRQLIRLNHVFQPPHEFRIGIRRYAPRGNHPGLEVVFFSAW